MYPILPTERNACFTGVSGSGPTLVGWELGSLSTNDNIPTEARCTAYAEDVENLS